MRRIWISLFFFALLAHWSDAQQLRFDLGYRYLHAPQWDKAIQTYNFSRPFLEEPQPLLRHGCSATVDWCLPGEGKLRHGPTLTYSLTRSAADHAGLATSLHLHMLQVGYLIRYAPSQRQAGFYTQLSLSASAIALYRRINQEALWLDDARMRAVGIGGEVQLKAGYGIVVSDGFSIAPFAGVGFSPYLHAPGVERVLNQTQGLTGGDGTVALSLLAGISFGLGD
jgi:hypothetical protein